MVTWILGELHSEVFSAANSLIPEIGAIGDWDNVDITMKFPSGTLAQVDLSRWGVTQGPSPAGQVRGVWIRPEA
jgi:hypothetical protein